MKLLMHCPCSLCILLYHLTQDNGKVVNNVASQLKGPGFQFQLGQGFSLDIPCSPWCLLGLESGVSPQALYNGWPLLLQDRVNVDNQLDHVVCDK